LGEDDPAMHVHDEEPGRPRTSIGTIYAAVAVISMIISGGTGTIFYLNGMRNDLSVLQAQVVRDESEMKQSHDDQRAFASEMRASLSKISDDIRSIVAKDGRR
jgi:hypothetical protein